MDTQEFTKKFFKERFRHHVFDPTYFREWENRIQKSHTGEWETMSFADKDSQKILFKLAKKHGFRMRF